MVSPKECIGPTNGNFRCASRQVITCPYAAQAKNMTAMKFLILVLVVGGVVVAPKYNWSGVKTLSKPRVAQYGKGVIAEHDIFAHGFGPSWSLLVKK